ncbi:unnamed protein product [Brassica rapa]|uniref:Peroxin-13 n=1 Tax=Brassica campestris TaxID=3711 RepID=A0A8D9LXY1_BRACM|nr:unnamed protein product [Brassica rapa]
MATSHPSGFRCLVADASVIVHIIQHVILLQLSVAIGGRPPKPWERAGNNNTSGPPKPFRPPSNTSTADSVEASGTADRNHTPANMNALSRPLPIRPRQQQQTFGGMCR